MQWSNDLAYTLQSLDERDLCISVVVLEEGVEI